MVRLTTPSGATVSVSAEKAKRLIAEGYKAVAEKKSPAKKAASSKNTK